MANGLSAGSASMAVNRMIRVSFKTGISTTAQI